MSQSSDSTIIKKYANRRLYNTGTSTYVTLEDLAVMVKNEEDFCVVDAKTGEDITRSVLTQIIFEQESKGHNLLPINFLRNLIQVYGDSVQTIVPSYLEQSMEAFRQQQDQFRDQITSGFGSKTALDMMSEQARRNTEIFQQAMQVFMPFGGMGSSGGDDAASDEDISAMKEQLAELQAKLKAAESKK